MLFSTTFMYNLRDLEYTCFIGQADRTISIGRNEISDKIVSRQHFQLIKRKNKLFIKDLGSKNGTCLNGIRVRPEEEIELQINDLIGVPGCVLFVSDNPRFEPSKLQISLCHLCEDICDSDLKSKVPFLELINSKDSCEMLLIAPENQLFMAIDQSYCLYERDFVMDDLMELLLLQEFDKLACNCEKLISYYPEDHELLNIYHIALLALGGNSRKERAIECLHNAIGLAPEVIGYKNNLSSILR